MRLKMQYQKITKSTGKIVLILSLLLSISCAVQTSVVADPITATEPMSLISFGTLDSEQEINKLVSFLNKIENPKQLQLECDKQSIAKSCYYYASYYDLILKDYKESYVYYKKAYNLGIKEAGYFVGVFQINHSGIFDVDKRLSIDESIYYLEQAFKAGSPDATRILMMTYRDLELNRIDYDKSEYYNKIAIEQEVKHSRYLLAYLYTNDIKDKSKVDESIELYKEDLTTEQNWQSALALMNIYLAPEEYGAEFEPDIVKTLAYAYVSSDLRDGQNVGDFNNVDTRFAQAMQTELPPETLKQAKAMYFELMAKMNEERANLDNAIPKDN